MKKLMQPVDMIATFGKDWAPRPYKFRYEDPNQQRHEVVVDRILCVDKRHMAGMDTIFYVCQSELRGELRLYELKYILPQCRWELHKM